MDSSLEKWLGGKKSKSQKKKVAIIMNEILTYKDKLIKIGGKKMKIERNVAIEYKIYK